MCGVTCKDKIRNEHIREHNEIGTEKYNGETIELVWTCDEEIQRTHTEESVEDGYTREKEERMTENKMERHVPTKHEKYLVLARKWTERHGVGRSSVIPCDRI